MQTHVPKRQVCIPIDPISHTAPKRFRRPIIQPQCIPVIEDPLLAQNRTIHLASLVREGQALLNLFISWAFVLDQQ